MYFMNGDNLEIWLGFVTVTGYMFCLVMGYLFTQYLIINNFIRLALFFMVYTIFLQIIFISQTLNRLFVYGTYREFVDGNIGSVFFGRLCLDFLLIIPYFVLPLGYIIKKLYSQGKELEETRVEPELIAQD